jgi:hypothetical protein
MLSGRDKHIVACQLCGCDRPLTFHHLIPRKMHRRKHFRTHYDKDQLNSGIMVCRFCHLAVHRLYDEMTLAKHFSRLELLLADSAVQKHIAWVVKKR